MPPKAYGVIFLPPLTWRVSALLSLLEFLASAPKSYVIRIHRRENPGEGLLPAAKVIQLVNDWALRSERVRMALQEADVQGRYLLGLVYVSQNRGASETELLSAQEGFPPSQASLLLAKLEQEMLLYSRQGETARSYHGFEELAETVLSTILPEHWITGAAGSPGTAAAAATGAAPAGASSGAESANWISYRHFLPAHLSHFLGQVELAAVKITQNGEMHRKDSQELAGRFAFGERLSASIPGEEVHFLLRFAVHSRLVAQEEGMLRLTTEGKAFLRLRRGEAERRLREWWLESRLRGLSHTLKALASLPPAAARIAPIANLLWIHSGTQRKTYLDSKSVFTWENLPRALQEVWLQGLVDFGMSKGRIGWIRPTRGLAELLAGAWPESTTSKPVSLPNLESLVPLDAPLDWQRRLELVAVRSNDEFMARYQFTKESVIQGLQAGLSMDEFRELLTWLGYEGPATRTLLDWASTYASTLFMDALILKVSDPIRLRELKEIPQFMELITESIPDYGFVLSRQNKPRVRELLQHFGLVPGEDSRRVPQHEPVMLEGPGTWELPAPEAGSPGYREIPNVLRATAPVTGEKPTKEETEKEVALRLETIETAIQEERKVEFNYHHTPVPKHVTLKPLLLLRHRTPIKLIGIEVDSGHRNEYLLDQVKALRFVE